jgi:hypothetical protein
MYNIYISGGSHQVDTGLQVWVSRGYCTDESGRGEQMGF